MVIVSADNDEAGYNKTIAGMPWVATKLNADRGKIEEHVPCTGYPTPGIINGKTGEPINLDAFGACDTATLKEHLKKIN